MTVLNSDPSGHHVSLISNMLRLNSTLVTGARQRGPAQVALASRMGLQQVMPRTYATKLTRVPAEAGVAGTTRNCPQRIFDAGTRNS